jgi:hypothetical protein
LLPGTVGAVGRCAGVYFALEPDMSTNGCPPRGFSTAEVRYGLYCRGVALVVQLDALLTGERGRCHEFDCEQIERKIETVIALMRLFRED